MNNLSKLLAKGDALVRQGDIAGARAVFEKAAGDHGHRSEPWASLSAIHGMQGDFAEALRCARRAVELSPNSLQGWVNLAYAAQSRGEFRQAADAFERAASLPGCPEEIVLELGIALARLGDWPGAEQPLREYRRRHPDHREATLTLCKVLAQRGNVETAIAACEAYCRQHPDDAGAGLELGNLYLEAGRVHDAWRICDQVLEAEPGATEALFLKVSLLMHERRPVEARDVLEQLNRRLPANIRVLMALHQACQELGDKKAGVAYAQAILKLDPRNVHAMLSLSSALIYDDNVEAWKYLERAQALAPTEPSLLSLKAELLELKGDKSGAWDCVRATLDNGSADTRAAVVAASVAPAIGQSTEAIARLERLVRRPGLSASNHSILRFALANLCDKSGQYDRAFEHAVIANQLKNMRHDNNALLAQISRLKAIYCEPAIASLPRSRNRAELPLFIVGMPRSGTSLLEQILSRHSQLHARGETEDIPAIAETIPYYPDGARELKQEKLDALADAHIRRLQESAPGAARVTDKLPGNFLLLGIIGQLFPGARVVNCRRDPRDVCLSNFLTDFGAGHQYAYHLESLAQVYKAYQELMEHWKAVLPIPILDVRYEDMVADPRAQIEKVLNFCGLEWEDACLDFHRSARQVVTASYDQVRQPLYQRSVGRWKNYARHLEPVSRILGLRDDASP